MFDHARGSFLQSTDQQVYLSDRRRALRHEVMQPATAVPRGVNPFAMTHTFQLRNLSHTGLAAVSPVPMPLDQSLTLLLGSHGPDGAIEMNGRVVRCRPVAEIAEHAADASRLTGWEIAVEFELPLAA
jgi:hypothetical protein